MAGSTWCKSDVNRSFFLCLAACRTRSSACDTLARSCARRGALLVGVFHWFPSLAPPAPLRIAPLVRRLHGYYNGIRLLGSVHRRLRLLVSRRGPTVSTPPAKPEASRFPCKELPHMLRVFDHAGLGGRSRYRASLLPSVILTTSGVRKYQAFAARWLAYALPCQRFAGILADTAA